MSSQWVPLNFEQHGHMKISDEKQLAHLASTHLVPIVVKEIAAISSDVPVLCVKNSQTGQLELVALMGFRTDKNVFVTNGEWQGSYVPLYAKNAPLIMATLADTDKLALCVDETSELFNAHEGQDIFQSNGGQSVFLQDRIAKLLDFKEFQQTTKKYLDLLLELDLLVEQTLNVELGTSERLSLDGVFQVDMNKLKMLDDNRFLMLRKSGYLTAIYAQMLSMQQLPKLVKRSL